MTSWIRSGLRGPLMLGTALLLGPGLGSCSDDDASCAISEDCRASEVCVDHVCRLRCTSHQDCTGHDRCLNGACRPAGEADGGVAGDTGGTPDRSSHDHAPVDRQTGVADHLGGDAEDGGLLADLRESDAERLCMPGQRRCGPTGDAEECNLAGNGWNLFDDCSPVAEECFAGSCSCMVQHHQGCYGGDVYWFDGCNNPEGRVEDCAQDCDLGQCVVELSCTPAARRCTASGDVEQCNLAGDGWELFEDCNALTHDCVGDGCVCRSQQHKGCFGGDVYWYDACGLREGLYEDCGDGICDNGACLPALFCTPGERRCSTAGDVEECSLAGDAWALLEECNLATHSCSGAQCICIPDHDRACVGTAVFWYDGCGQIGEQAQDCAELELICDQGECVTGISCTPGEHRCASTTQVEICNPAGDNWLPQELCDGTTQLCSGGACICIPQHHLECRSDDLYWIDGCGELDGLHQACSIGCSNGACLVCVADQLRCSDQDDVEYCATGGMSWQLSRDCPDDQEACTGDPPHCECIPHHHTTCLGDDLYWSNGCSNLEELITTCVFGCTEGVCRICTPGNQRCSAEGNAERCSEAGDAWLLELVCTLGCQPDYTCLCVGDEVQCDGQCDTCPQEGQGHVFAAGCVGQRCLTTVCDDGYLPCPTGCCAHTPQIIGGPNIMWDMPQIDLAVDRQNQPALAFQDYGSHYLRYGWRDTSWHFESVEYVHENNFHGLSLAFTPDDRPVIAWTKASALYLSFRDESGWHDSQLATTGATSYVDLAFDSMGVMHLAFRDQNGISWLQGSPEVYTIETASIGEDPAQVRPFVALALDRDDWPHIAYLVLDESSAYHVRVASLQGSDWLVDEVSSFTNPPWSLDLEVDLHGAQHLTYSFSGPSDVYYGYREPLGGIWQTGPVACGGQYGALALIDRYEPRVLCGLINPWKVLLMTPHDGGWHPSVIDPSYPASAVYLAYDQEGRAHMAYLWGSARDLRYTH